MMKRHAVHGGDKGMEHSASGGSGAHQCRDVLVRFRHCGQGLRTLSLIWLHSRGASRSTDDPTESLSLKLQRRSRSDVLKWHVERLNRGHSRHRPHAIELEIVLVVRKGRMSRMIEEHVALTRGKIYHEIIVVHRVALDRAERVE